MKLEELGLSATACAAAAAAEWYAPYSTVRPLIQAQAQCSDTILVLAGPQPSCLHEDLYDSGYRGVTLVHSESSHVQALRQQQAEHSRSITCQVGTMAEVLAFDHLPYNVIIDKGYVDAVLCKDTGVQEAEAVLINVWRNLKGPGTYLLFTHGPPSLRLPLIRTQPWASTVVKAIVEAHSDSIQLVNTDDAHPVDAAAYVYICKKPYT